MYPDIDHPLHPELMNPGLMSCLEGAVKDIEKSLPHARRQKRWFGPANLFILDARAVKPENFKEFHHVVGFTQGAAFALELNANRLVKAARQNR